MRFTPKSQEEIDAENLLPKGEYDFEIIKAEDKVSKSGNEMIEINMKVFKPDGGFQFVRDYLMEKMAFKLRHFCESIGQLEEYNAGQLQASNLVGACGVVKIDIEPASNGYAAKNTAKDYAVRGGSKREQTPVDLEGDDTTILF